MSACHLATTLSPSGVLFIWYATSYSFKVLITPGRVEWRTSKTSCLTQGQLKAIGKEADEPCIKNPSSSPEKKPNLLQDFMSSNFSQVLIKLFLSVNFRPKPFSPSRKSVPSPISFFMTYIFPVFLSLNLSPIFSTTSSLFLTYIGRYIGLRPKISLRNLDPAVLPFFLDQQGLS